MKKKSRMEDIHPTKNIHHPLFREQLSFGQQAADAVGKLGGSWKFIIFFSLFLVGWMAFNTFYLMRQAFDPFPYILLNLVLSCLAAFQAPIILMAEHRQAERDRIDAMYDHAVNRKAEREIQIVQKELHSIKQHLHEILKRK